MRFRPSSAARCASPALILGLIALGGCQSMQPSTGKLLGVITPYKIEIVQGNVVTQEQAALIRPGMSRLQVREILGSPLLTDVFHADRWDYVFTIRRQGTEPQMRRVVVRFDGDALKSIDTGGELPTEHDFITSIDTFKTAAKAPILELSAEQIQALPIPPRPAPATEAAPVGPERSYPPLEPAR
ncbi:MAG: outer membrane protein assembly factor BamE [Burkholderiaceae bacterium]